MITNLARVLIFSLTTAFLVGSLALIAFFVGNEHVRCGPNPDIITFYLAIAALSATYILWQFA